MTQAPAIHFIGMEPSGALAALARSRAEDLDRLHAGILSCQIAIQQERHRNDRAGHFSVCVEMVIAAGREWTEIRTENKDVYAALGHAFERSKLNLERAARRSH